MSTTAQKIATIVRCIERAREEHTLAGAAFRSNFTHQDAAVLNITRACEAAVDLANMLIRKKRIGIPSDMKESFALLERSQVLAPDLSKRLQNMVGFRNLAVHQYQELNLDIVESIIRKDLDDLLKFAETVRPLLDTGV